MFFIKNLLIFFGGKSPERDVSVITGLLTLNSVDASLYNAIPVYVDGEGRFFSGEALKDMSFYRNPAYSTLFQVSFLPGESKAFLTRKRKKKELQVYCAVNCMHGRGGEDGILVGLLKNCAIPFVSPDLFASAVAIDKDFTKIVLSGLKINTLPYVRVKRVDFFKRSAAFIKYVKNKLGFPVIVKPARLGSSIGIEKVDNEEQLFSSFCSAFNYDDKIICEPFMQNARDLNCAVYEVNGKLYASKIEEALRKSDILSFNDKYGNGDKAVGSDRRYPTDLSAQMQNEICKISKKIYRSLDFSSIVRFDFLLCKNNLYLNEINAVPGSMAYYLFCDKFSQFKELLTSLIEEGVEHKRKEDKYVTFYKSEILYGDYKGVKK